MLQNLLRWLADRPNVHSIAPRARIRPANFLATGICQSATAGSVDPSTSQVLDDADTRPFWAAGLQVDDHLEGLNSMPSCAFCSKKKL